jgi:glycosyltransferase involved in cell wall biosynthesis
MIFRARKAPGIQPEPSRQKTGPVTLPRTVFVMPEIENAFRWVTESLAEALTMLGHPAWVVPPDSSRVPSGATGPKRIGWAHYWPAYREAAAREQPGYEVFVTNFEMTPRGHLTPWVSELCARPSIKLAVSNFCRDVLLGLGVPEDRVHVIPHGYSPEFAARVRPLPLATRKSFRFLAVVNSHDPYRYGTDILLDAYREAFRENDDVCLVIKDYGANAAATQSWFDDGGGPEILYYANFLEKPELAAFYAACSAFAAPFRGEGFGMKILDAAVAGLPLIVPLYGGPLDYCVPELVQPVAFERRPVGKCLDTDQIEWKEEIAWCEPSADDLAARMRWVYENQGAAAEKAARLRPIAIEQFSWEAAARKLLAIIE